MFLLYSVDWGDGIKRELAHAWLTSLWRFGTGRLNWQVLNEFYANAARKVLDGLRESLLRDSPNLAAGMIDRFR